MTNNLSVIKRCVSLIIDNNNKQKQKIMKTTINNTERAKQLQHYIVGLTEDFNYFINEGDLEMAETVRVDISATMKKIMKLSE